MKFRKSLKVLFRKLTYLPATYETIAYFINIIFSFVVRKKNTPVHKETKDKKFKTDSKTVLILMHWLSVGGAEKFACDCIKYYRSKGYSIHLFIEKQSENFYGSVIFEAERIIKYYDNDMEVSFEQLGDEILSGNFAIIHNHHTDVFYSLFDEYYNTSVLYIDTLHIVELPVKHYGYPRSSLQYTDYIDFHHVISENLVEYFAEAGVAPEKVVYGNLNFNNISATLNPSFFSEKNDFRVGFLGRMERQKRPLLFLYLAKHLKNFLWHLGYHTEFFMMGEGYYQKDLVHLVKSYGMSDNVQFFPKNYNIDNFFEQIDILLMTSENEGLALVALEALTRNKIVISTNVGSQMEIISDFFLIRSNPLFILKDLKLIFKNMLENSREYIDGVNNQVELIQKFINKDNAWVALDRVLQCEKLIR